MNPLYQYSSVVLRLSNSLMKCFDRKSNEIRYPQLVRSNQINVDIGYALHYQTQFTVELVGAPTFPGVTSTHLKVHWKQ